MRRSYYLIHRPNPLAAREPVFDVREGGAVLTASGLASTDVIPIEVRVRAVNNLTQAEDTGVWAPYIRNGCPVVLSAANTVYVELVPNTYRLAPPPALSATAVVAFAENEKSLEGTVRFNYDASPCAASSGGGGGPSTITLSDVNFVGGADQWMCDATGSYVFAQVVIDVDTGAKSWAYLQYPGGPAATATLPLRPCVTSPFEQAYADRASGIVSGAYAIALGSGSLRSYTLIVAPGGTATRTNGPDAGVVFPAGTYSFSAPMVGDGVERGRLLPLPAFNSTGDYMVLWTEG